MKEYQFGDFEAGTAKFSALLGFVFCVLILLFFAPKAAAHTDPHEEVVLDTTAYDVAKDRDKLEDFVRHASLHLRGASNFRESLGLLNDFREEGGDWFHDDSTYLMLLTKGGGVYVHAKQRDLEDQDWSQDIVGCNGETWNEVVESKKGCVMYKGQDTEKVPPGYAFVAGGSSVPFAAPGSEESFVLIGGLDYRPESVTYTSFDELLASIIDSFVKKTPTLSEEQRATVSEKFEELVAMPEIDASEVATENDLRIFLGGALGIFEASFLLPIIDPVVLRRMFRFEGGPWKNGSTYIYIMDDVGNVIFNGSNRNIEQTDLWNFKDGDDPFIQRILEAAQGTGSGCSESAESEGEERDKPHFVCYNWDNPNVEGDEPPDGGAGGTSYKIGYSLQFPPDGEEGKIYVFGTGLYLEVDAEEDEGGDGCSIAGNGATSAGAAANALFIMVLLVLAILLKVKAGPVFLMRRTSSATGSD